MLRDRGTKKWTAMMIPEHVAKLNELYDELSKIEQPEIDPQQLEEFEVIIAEAMEENQELELSYWKEGIIYNLVGCIHYVDLNTKNLRVIDNQEERHFVSFSSLVDLRIR
ncbi:YolD-like family protein [Bacillus alkalicellulosilyticus]|uniref:YolD-like family protein n=1 Tax=Alkalihalobacterium alkalicellulosilyticum TaxID=1912214 RepID=UPI0009971897|nr:YolD-like family protein [Bacillus alkalicellulosilyticus]